RVPGMFQPRRARSRTPERAHSRCLSAVYLPGPPRLSAGAGPRRHPGGGHILGTRALYDLTGTCQVAVVFAPVATPCALHPKPLLDDLICPRQHRGWDGEAEGFGGLEVADQLRLRRLLHRSPTRASAACGVARVRARIDCRCTALDARVFNRRRAPTTPAIPT